jgi:elongation factor P
MAVIKAVDLRRGRVINHEGGMWTVVDIKHSVQQQRAALMRTKIKNFVTGQVLEVRFDPEQVIDVPFLENKEYEYLYDEGDLLVLMDTETYDQIQVPKEMLGDSLKFLVPNTKVMAAVTDAKVITVELPQVVELKVTEAPPVVKGATATNQPKDAIVETGARVRVPPFIDTGEVIRVDTRTGEYLERAK